MPLRPVSCAPRATHLDEGLMRLPKVFSKRPQNERSECAPRATQLDEGLKRLPKRATGYAIRRGFKGRYVPY